MTGEKLLHSCILGTRCITGHDWGYAKLPFKLVVSNSAHKNPFITHNHNMSFELSVKVESHYQ